MFICGSLIRLIALDLDGTLLNRQKRVSADCATAIAAAIEKGVKVVLASARPPRGVRAIYGSLKLDTLQINYNGALIWDEPGNRPVFHRPMPGRLVRHMIDLARDYADDAVIAAEILDRWYTDRHDPALNTETGKLFPPDVVAPLETWCDQHVTKLMFMGEPSTMLRLEALLVERFADDVTILQTDDHLLQIMDRRCGKAAALKKLAAHYGVKANEVLAVGDALNDVGMLQYAGVAVAMHNAHKTVKAVADWVAPSNDEHGVAETIRKYVLNHP